MCILKHYEQAICQRTIRFHMKQKFQIVSSKNIEIVKHFYVVLKQILQNILKL